MLGTAVARRRPEPGRRRLDPRRAHRSDRPAGHGADPAAPASQRAGHGDLRRQAPARHPEPAVQRRGARRGRMTTGCTWWPTWAIPTGQPRYSAADALRVQRVVVRLDTGFSPYPMVDPVIVGDVNGNGRLDAADALLIQRKVVRLPVPRAARPALAAAGGDPDRTGPGARHPRRPEGASRSADHRPDQPGHRGRGWTRRSCRCATTPRRWRWKGCGRGSLTGDFQAFLVLNDPGPAAARHGAVERAHGRHRQPGGDRPAGEGQRGAGQYALDLEWASLNAGRLVLTPEPVPGLDGTDGSVAIEAKPAVATQKAISRAIPCSARTSGHAGASITQRSASQTPTPVIDWSARVAPTSPVRPLVKPEEGWTKDFVVNLGQSDNDRKPNDKLRLAGCSSGQRAR